MNNSGFYIYNGRLAQFKHWKNSAEGWEDRWSSFNLAKMLTNARNGGLGEYEVISPYLKKDLPILEAGCGMGHIVMALASRGFISVGIDYSEKTIQKIKEICPELNVRVGDINDIDAPSGKYGGYISLGVLEHNPEGPLKGLSEARRVVHPKGYAFFSIPYLNPGRKKWLKKLEPFDESPNSADLQFYQYYFDDGEFSSFLEETRFSIVNKVPVGVFWGLTSDNLILKNLSDKKFFDQRLYNAFYDWCKKAGLRTRKKWGHMMIYICKPV